jgi:hypothetical protein
MPSSEFSISSWSFGADFFEHAAEQSEGVIGVVALRRRILGVGDGHVQHRTEFAYNGAGNDAGGKGGAE